LYDNIISNPRPSFSLFILDIYKYNILLILDITLLVGIGTKTAAAGSVKNQKEVVLQLPGHNHN
jgi:hypothetical protein